MDVIYQYRIHREDCWANPNLLYVFGDNLARVGLGGQAGEMRGEPNAFGFATKRNPATCFRGDDSDWATVKEELSKLQSQLVKIDQPGGVGAPLLPRWRAVVWPIEGIGTGLSRMPEFCPNLFEYMENQLLTLGIRNRHVF